MTGAQVVLVRGQARVLDAIEDHDPDSWDWPAATRPLTEWRPVQWPIDGLVLDQARIGACVPMAAATFLNARPPRKRGSKVPPWREVDAIHWYGSATRIDRIPGVFDPYSSRALRSEDTGTTVNALAKVLRARGIIREWRTAFGLEHMRGALQLGPVLITCPWDWSMFHPDRHGYIKRGGPTTGRHAVVAWADDNMNTMRLRLTYGRWWGLAGDCLIRYSTMDSLLGEGGDATVLVP